jgi:hypothetical protein
VPGNLGSLTVRGYQGPGDLELQNAFWKDATRKLPWAWKPTLSPLLFAKNRILHPSSRRFAFDGERLVGYMSFTGEGSFVSLGYPWVLDGYEGVLQERLFDDVFRFAASAEHGGQVFAQRFREQWASQMQFFLRKGFQVGSRQPIYALSVHKPPETTATSLRIQKAPSFDVELFKAVARRFRQPSVETLQALSPYYASVDFDFTITARDKDSLVALMGVAVRRDNGFAEGLAVTIDGRYSEDGFTSCVAAIAGELRPLGVTDFGMALSPEYCYFDSAVRLGFKKVTEDVIVMKAEDGT